MSQDTEKYLYFNVGLLKDSFALNALWQDALKYHMIDQPGKLIALRLTEYYEMLSNGLIQTGSGAPMKTPLPTSTLTPISSSESRDLGGASESNEASEQDLPGSNVVATSPNAEQNADEAAEYWALL